MIKTLLILLCLICTAGIGTATGQEWNRPARNKDFKHKERILTKYDKFKDRTQVMLYNVRIYKSPNFLINHEFWLTAGFSYEGREVPTPQKIVLFFNSESEQWRYLGNRTYEVLVIADGERLSLGYAERTESKIHPNAHVSETLKLEISNEVFRRLVKAQTVEMQVGITEMKLKNHHIEALRDFASRMTSEIPTTKD